MTNSHSGLSLHSPVPFHSNFIIIKLKAFSYASVKKGEILRNMTDEFRPTIKSVSPLRINLFSALFNTTRSVTAIPIHKIIIINN